jgi:hypothetical protein
VIGWWFAAEPRLPHGDGRPVILGETLRVDPPVELCRHGLHASEHPFDALQYASGPLLYRVCLGGQIIRDDDKCCASERTALAVREMTIPLRRFACDQALSVIHMWNGPEVVKTYLTTMDEAIRDAAWDAARAAAWDAARAAARKDFQTRVEAIFAEGEI